MPKEARWSKIKDHAISADIGQVIDEAMEAIERENDSLKGVLTKNYSRPELDKTRLGELVTLFTNIEVGSTAAQERDVLGRVYEYFLSKFASAEGKLSGEFYTPSCIVRTLVEMIEPFEGQIFDPACGSGGMFCQSARFIKEHLFTKIASNKQTTGLGHVTITDLKKIKVTIPSLYTQMTIINTIKPVDDKIDINKAINRNLNMLAI